MDSERNMLISSLELLQLAPMNNTTKNDINKLKKYLQDPMNIIDDNITRFVMELSDRVDKELDAAEALLMLGTENIGRKNIEQEKLEAAEALLMLNTNNF